MMGVKAVFELFCDCWNLYYKYAVSNLENEELQQFLDTAQELYHDKYSADNFSKDMIVAVVNEIERLEKRNNVSEEQEAGK